MTAAATTVAGPVDVVVLTWNDGPMLDRAVASVVGSVEVEASVIVVDNGSDPPAQVTAGDAVLIRNDQNRGVAAGRNQGIRAGSAPYVCLLDSDAQLDAHCLVSLVRSLEGSSDIAMAVPVYVDQVPEASAGRAPSLGLKLRRVLGLQETYVAPERDGGPAWEVDFGIGACQLFRRVAFESVGGIDETYFYGPEDVDFCLRLRERGWRILQVEGARCIHPPRRRFRNVFTRRGAQHGFAVARHLWRHRHAARLS